MDKVYLFDMDDTLMDSVWVWEKMFDTFFEEEGKDVRFQRDVGQYFRQMSVPEIARYIKTNILTSSDWTEEEIYEEIRKRILHLYTTEVELKPGIVSFLEQAKQQGIRMAVVTGSEGDIAEQTLEHFGIRHYFQGVYSCGDLGLSKRGPQLLEHALRVLNADPSQTILFEDSMYAIEVGRELGITCIGLENDFNREDFRNNYVPVMTDFTEPIPL